MAEKICFDSLSTCILDDDEIMLFQLESILRSVGIAHVTRLVGDKSLVKTFHIILNHDCLFLDINMPDMDGVEVLRQLAFHKYKGIIILFSGENTNLLRSAEKLAQAHNLNILGSVEKPASKAAIEQLFLKPISERSLSINREQKLYNIDELKASIANNEFIPYFQPQIDIKTKKIIGFESLARWKRHDGLIISPLAFIPAIESKHLMGEFTLSLFKQTIKHLKRIIDQGYTCNMSFNISPSCLEDINLPERFSEIMDSYSLPHNYVTMEITESTIVDKLSVSLDVLTRLRLKGFGLSIDDFGTGYSSMKQLHQIPFTELKIDREFVHNSTIDQNANAILEFCASLAKKLKLKIIAEGVEDTSDWSSATQAGCDVIQGYYVAKPKPIEELLEWIEEVNNNDSYTIEGFSKETNCSYSVK